MNQPQIVLDNVTKRFGDQLAVKPVNLEIEAGEFIAIMGSSGCGKTTTLRMLAGLETPTGGEIRLNNQRMNELKAHERETPLVWQSLALFPFLTVQENFEFGLKMRGVPKSERAARAKKWLQRMEIDQFAERSIDQLSGGQRQRVALARALVTEPPVLLLDEPLGALDKKLRQDTQFELMDIQEKTGTTFVIVTHDQEEAMTVASRIAVMDEGRMIQVDTPARIYEAPNTVYVADFIGDVNIIEGRATPAGEHVHIAWGEGVSDITGTTDKSFDSGEKVHFAIRPEKVSVSVEKPDGTPNAFQGKVLDIAYLGNLSTYHVEMSNGQIIKAQSANTRRLSRRAITWDDSVWISFTATAGVLLKG